MRTLLLASALVVLAACSDSEQPTAPRSTSAQRSAAGQATTPAHTVSQPYAKPTDQVGFTKITQVSKEAIPISAGSLITALATCPVGTTVVSGGHNLAAVTGAYPLVGASLASLPDNSWAVTIWNGAVGAAPVILSVYAYCAS